MREKQYSITFDRLKVGAKHFRNGYTYKKVAPNTSEIITPDIYRGKFYHCYGNEQCIINQSQIKTDVKG